MTRNFREMLTRRQEQIGSMLCVGLDPLVNQVPERIIFAGRTPAEKVLLHMRYIVDMTAPYSSMFKPQSAYYEAIAGGKEVLRELIVYIKQQHPDVPIFLDCKRGDIDRTQQKYGEAHFALDGADGINYNGYMGSDTLKDLIDPNYPGRSLVGLGRTSNPSAWHVQDRRLADGRMVWEAMVKDILDWSNTYGVLENAGVVMGAAHKDPSDPTKINSAHLTRAREIVSDKLWFLIPGIGTQGGFVEETIKAAYMGPGSIAVNSSSGIIFASDPEEAARSLRDEMNKYL